MAASFPAFRDSPGFQEYLESLPEEFAAFAGDTSQALTYAGWMNLEFLNYAPLLLSFMALTLAARSLAGEEEEGTADLILARPLSRRRMVIEKFFAAATALAAVALAIGVVVVLSGWAIGERFHLGKFLSAGLYAFPLALAITAIGLAASAAFHRRAPVYLVGSFLIIGLFLLNTLGKIIGALEDVRKISPFYHYDETRPLTGGLDPWYAAYSLGLVLVGLAVAMRLFARKDLTR